MEHGIFEDVFPIENGDFPACYVSLPEGIVFLLKCGLGDLLLGALVARHG